MNNASLSGLVQAQSSRSYGEQHDIPPLTQRMMGLVERVASLEKNASELGARLGVSAVPGVLREARKPSCQLDEHLSDVEARLDGLANQLVAALDRI